MSKLRIQKQGVTYLTWSYCINFESMLHSDELKNMVIDAIVHTKEKYKSRFEINNFCILDNRIYFVITTKRRGPQISRIMQRVKFEVGRIYNKWNDRKGPFWIGRYEDKLCMNQDEALDAMIKVSSEPIKDGVCDDIRDYKYSGITMYYYNYQWQFITPLKGFLILGSDMESRRRRFMELWISYWIAKSAFRYI